ncbi:TPA: DUF551 domain-containing protein [Acinetobacter baumannii]|uniref:DUF551 domain-containing protein n=1 Tax=Acinetobacter baumannii TaxID=470 RepID=UPI0002BA4903|nr:DUF551 domain-containing protein [Acinetobacter baumannii]AGH35009.1 hypothetical protein ABD1_11210 [Acinetobacter baumannii D1279779]PHM87440.1 DUF551 domain-containing protein [Acinetobacter baumannii]HAV5339732.1 DUF551 domain-containing protein [Acinetobacter baumannii]HAV5343665.1 DUF551 domain-containing protein [Acinetobacter baumannii]HAV5552454.1 DUF551 domain-containing protein [Acinetobacter baumannii]
MIDLNKKREAFERFHAKECNCSYESLKRQLDRQEALTGHRYLPTSPRHEAWLIWDAAWNDASAQVLPTWISVTDELPPADIIVLICWADAPDVTPEQDYMTIDEDLNSVWANYQNDPPSHWMHFHSVPNVSGAEQ